MKRSIAISGLLLLFTIFAIAKMNSTSGDSILGTWLNQEGTAHVLIAKSGTNYTGKIVWLKEPVENGKPKTDKNNPEVSRRSTPLMGLIILKDFIYDGEEGEWTDGTIYDPKNGKTYSCTMTLEDGRLNVRGYIGISLIGRTAVWTRVKR